MGERQNRNLKFGEAVSKHTVHVDPPVPPPSNIISQFKTLEAWLIHICDSEHPQKYISEFQFLLFKSSSGYIVSLEGHNTYKINNEVSVHRLDFKPPDMFFPLPIKEYSNLTLQEVRQRIIKELKEFTKTTKFQNSFLSKSDTITNNFADIIWSR